MLTKTLLHHQWDKIHHNSVTIHNSMHGKKYTVVAHSY